jgi:hypothetical protein
MPFPQTRGFDSVHLCILRHVRGDVGSGLTREARIRDCAKLLDSMTGYTSEERSNAIKAAQIDGYLTSEEVERLSQEGR